LGVARETVSRWFSAYQSADLDALPHEPKPPTCNRSSTATAPNRLGLSGKSRNGVAELGGRGRMLAATGGQ
jgi:hypothetical protein